MVALSTGKPHLRIDSATAVPIRVQSARGKLSAWRGEKKLHWQIFRRMQVLEYAPWQGAGPRERTALDSACLYDHPQQLRANADDLGAYGFDGGLLAFVLEIAVGLERVIGAVDHHLGGNHDDADVGKDRAQHRQTADATEVARGRRHQTGNLALVRYQRRLVRLRPRGPVDGIFQHAGNSAVVLGRTDQESVVLDQQTLEHLGVRRQPMLALDVAVVKRHGNVTQIDLGHRGSGGTRACSGDPDQLLVERAAAQASRERNDPDIG